MNEFNGNNETSKASTSSSGKATIKQTVIDHYVTIIKRPCSPDSSKITSNAKKVSKLTVKDSRISENRFQFLAPEADGQKQSLKLNPFDLPS